MAQIGVIKRKGIRSGKMENHLSLPFREKVNGWQKVARCFTDKGLVYKREELILSAYAYIESMSTDISMSPAPPSNRWWERLGRASHPL